MEHPIETFKILGLYGERNITIDFDSNVKIIVAENGYGKTTVLNALYAILAGDTEKLRKIPFESISIAFTDGDVVELSKSSLTVDLSESIKIHSGIYNHLRANLTDNTIHTLIQLHTTTPWSRFKEQPQFVNSVRIMRTNPETLKSWLDVVINEIGVNLPDMEKVKNAFDLIKTKFSFDLLYLPTYRRVEEDLQTLGINDELQIDNSHQINFGMSDVKRRISVITSEILKSSVEWFSKVNGEMIAQLVEGFKINKEMKDSVADPAAIKIVLDRIGENISATTKEQIINLVDTGDISQGHDDLVYFLSKLVKVYEQQKDNDAAIQDFTSICNEYLVDKRILYNESKVTISVVRTKNSKNVDWENLSSGEKQIISLFARLYLDKKENLAIFFDEPELSLSIDWQKKLLPHIIKSKKCKFLFSTTHSPFIFENELDESASDLAIYVEELLH